MTDDPLSDALAWAAQDPSQTTIYDYLATGGAMSDLCCPNCGSKELATVERLMGDAYGNAIDDDMGPRFLHEGWTEIYWDSSESIGLTCRSCHWEQTGERDEPDFTQLKPCESES
jgi:hypothetical protein